MLNIITLQGRLAADCEVKNTPNGALATNFAVAVQRNFKNNQGRSSQMLVALSPLTVVFRLFQNVNVFLGYLPFTVK